MKLKKTLKALIFSVLSLLTSFGYAASNHGYAIVHTTQMQVLRALTQVWILFLYLMQDDFKC